jgi:hypothetical protein
MKKIFLVVLSFVLFGCASIPQEQYDMLQGTWMREDGATITFNGRNWETVDMTNGSAGYGTFEIRKDNRIQFTHTCILNLKMPVSDYPQRWYSTIELKEFQMRAMGDFNRLYPERVLQYDPEKYTPENNYNTYGESSTSTGGTVREYILERNNLTLIQIYQTPASSWVVEPFNGVFIRQ